MRVKGREKMEDSVKLSILQELIQINTVNGHEQPATEYLKQVLSDHGIEANLVALAAGRTNLVAEVGTENGPVLALAGHLDTVDVGDDKKWQHNPFCGQVIGDAVYGRGSVDMKGGLAAMVNTLIELKEAGLPKHGKVRLLATVDEEIGGLGSLELTRQGLVHDVDAMIVGEATTSRLEYAHSGSFDYRIKSYGHLAHSSDPSLGVNAVANLAEFFEYERHAFDDVEKSPSLGHLIHSVTVFHGGRQLNSIPDYAYLEGNVRTIPEFDNTAVQNRLQTIVDRLNAETDGRFELEVVASFMPMATDPNDPFVSLVQQSYQTVAKQSLPLAVSHGASDASRYILDEHRFPIIEWGPGKEEMSHQVDERLSVAEYLQADQVYLQIAKDFFGES
ncbi:ArgE/DapE family deacylase [Limosilactobacillus mucosae]|uniref:ArgE/DapE family deacylase n=2 Tax=Bacillota TaxID=1239 RepID=UPI003B9AC95B